MSIKLNQLIDALDTADSSFDKIVEHLGELVEAGQMDDALRLINEHPEQAARLRQLLPAIEALASFDELSDGTTTIPDVPTKGVLGDFRILREIGRGGMGTVFEAEQISMGRHVALKILPFAALVREKALQRFRNEVRTAAALDHPHIVSIYSVGEERGIQYYAMQLIRGQTLADMIHELRNENLSPRLLTPHEQPGRGVGDAATIDSAVAPPPSTMRIAQARISTAADSRQSVDSFRTTARLGIQAAEALQHAHDQGVLHRDIKPSNLLIDAEGQLHITDFGLARMEQDAGMTMTGDLLGTLRYMSPEQALAKRVVIDHRSDIYSLGATLYEIVTLQPAYAADDRQELLRQIAFEEAAKPRQINSRVPQDLETIVLKAIEKNPADRYTTAQELADDLRRFLDNQPINAKPPTWRDRAVKWSRRHPAGVRATFFALLTTTAVVAASVGWMSRDRAARQALLSEQVTLALDEAKTWYEAGKPTEAMSAVKRAEGLLASGEGSDKSKPSIAQWRADLETVERLENARFERATQRGAPGEASSVDLTYEDVFRTYGIDLSVLHIGESARRIRSAPIKDKLVAALDDWFQARAADDKGNGERKIISGRPELLQIARLADPNPWRNRLRDAVARGDEATLLDLAKEKEVSEQRPATITLLARALVARRKQLPAAIELLKQAQWQHPDDFWINIELANCLRFIHPQRTDEAISFRRVAVALRPNTAMAYNHLAVALAADGQYAEAEIAQQKAVSLAPNTIGAYAIRAQELDRQGKRSDAKALLRELMRLKPATTYEHHALAEALLHFGNIVAAEATIREAIRLAQNNYQSHQYLGEILQAQGKHAEAEVAFRDAIRIRPDILTLRCKLVESLELQGKRGDADVKLQELMQLEPSGHQECYSLAAVLLRLGKTHEAEKAMREAVERAPDFVQGHIGLSAILLAQKKHAESAAALRQAIRLAPENVEALNTLAWLLATVPNDDVRNGGEAVKLATRACELTEYKQAALIDTLAATYAEAGDFEAAIEWSQKSVDLATDDVAREELAKHLENFKAKRPWREPSVTNESVPQSSTPSQNPHP